MLCALRVPFWYGCRLTAIGLGIVIVEVVAVSSVEYWKLSAIPLLPSPIILCASICIANVSVNAALGMFICSCLYLIRRCDYVNMILEQLLSNEPLSDAYEFVNNSRTFTEDFNYMNHKGQHVWNCRQTHSHRPNDKLHRTAVILPRPRINAWTFTNTTATTAIATIGNVTNNRIETMNKDRLYGLAENENTLWDPEIDKLVSQLPLSRVRLYGRM